MTYPFRLLAACCFLFVVMVSTTAHANDLIWDNRVANSTHVTNHSLGDPMTVTWSITPDGTKISSNTSNLISTLDELYGVQNGNPTGDFSNRPWFVPIQNALDSFALKSGLTYIYEPNDDGADHFTVNGRYTDLNNRIPENSFSGELGVRGDLRITGYDFSWAGGFSAVPSSVALDSNFTPVDRGHSGIVLSSSFGNGVGLGNTGTIDFLITHENMHAVGSNHIRVNNSNSLSTVTGSGGTSQGPQFTDLLTLQRRYGDVNEKNNGNDSIANATNIGAVDLDLPIRLGFNAGIGTANSSLQVANDAVDFVSIDDDGDTDVYRFSVSGSQLVAIELEPRGPAYSFTNQRTGSTVYNIDASSLSDLSLSLFDSSGTLLDTVDANGVGDGESLMLSPPASGDYYVQVNGDADDIQFYALEISSFVATTAFYSQDFSDSMPISDTQGAIADDTLIAGTTGEVITGGSSSEQTVNGDYTITFINSSNASDANDGYIFNEGGVGGFRAYDARYNFETGQITFTANGTTYTGSVSLTQIVNVGQEFVNIKSVSLAEVDETGEIRIEIDYEFFADVPTPSGNDRFTLTTNFGIDTDVTNFDIFTADGFTGNNASGSAVHRLVLVAPAPFLLGDVDRDGVVNFLDIPSFIALLTSGGFQDEADIDRNGVVDFLDIPPFIALLLAQ